MINYCYLQATRFAQLYKEAEAERTKQAEENSRLRYGISR